MAQLPQDPPALRPYEAAAGSGSALRPSLAASEVAPGGPERCSVGAARTEDVVACTGSEYGAQDTEGGSLLLLASPGCRGAETPDVGGEGEELPASEEDHLGVGGREPGSPGVPGETHAAGCLDTLAGATHAAGCLDTMAGATHAAGCLDTMAERAGFPHAGAVEAPGAGISGSAGGSTVEDSARGEEVHGATASGLGSNATCGAGETPEQELRQDCTGPECVVSAVGASSRVGHEPGDAGHEDKNGGDVCRPDQEAEALGTRTEAASCGAGENRGGGRDAAPPCEAREQTGDLSESESSTEKGSRLEGESEARRREPRPLHQEVVGMMAAHWEQMRSAIAEHLADMEGVQGRLGAAWTEAEGSSDAALGRGATGRPTRTLGWPQACGKDAQGRGMEVSGEKITKQTARGDPTPVERFRGEEGDMTSLDALLKLLAEHVQARKELLRQELELIYKLEGDFLQLCEKLGRA